MELILNCMPTHVITDLSIKALGVLVALIGAIIALKEYRTSQNWKKAEFLAKEMKEFFDDFDVKRALWMLDWPKFTIPLSESEMINGLKVIEVDNDLLLTSLTYHEDRPKGCMNSYEGNYSATETRIRIIFDTFFQKLGTFQKHVDNKLFTYDDLEQYIAYYIKIIADKTNNRKSSQMKDQIMEFIHKYDYKPVEKLLEYYCKNQE